VIEKKRNLENDDENNDYKWLMEVCLPSIMGKSKWKRQVKSGLLKVKDLVSSSDEAFTLVSVLSYWHVWEYQAANNNGDDLTGAERINIRKTSRKLNFYGCR
jgi:hypothetical protein